MPGARLLPALAAVSTVRMDGCGGACPGATGPAGFQGVPGVQGLNGVPGVQGVPGFPGEWLQ